VLTSIGTIALLLLVVLLPLLIPVLVTVGHAVGSARGRRHQRRTGPDATATRLSDEPPLPAVDGRRLSRENNLYPAGNRLCLPRLERP
jgi:hypothetical protein